MSEGTLDLAAIAALSNPDTSSTSNPKEGFRPRKIRRQPEKHKICIQKRKVQRGQEHTTKSGKIIEKKFLPQNCNCKKRCSEFINVNRQSEIFNQFYALESWSKKILFLRSLVNKKLVKTDYSPIVVTKKRKFSYEYHMLDENGLKKRVCLSFFCKCFQISQNVVTKSVNSTTNPTATDRRGYNSARKTNQEDVDYLESFIRRFPTFESHYKLSQTGKQYLSPSLNIMRLYREYKLVCGFEGKTVLSEWMFREIFNTKFNLSFHPPKCDSCRTCDMIKAQIESSSDYDEKMDLETQRNLHLRIVEKTKQKFSELIDIAKNDGKTVVLTFDLQRTLELPVISTSEAYYKRQLCYYNLGIYDELTKIGHMHVWPEYIASRGSQEVASVLTCHLLKNLSNETEKIILFSDACPGQNRNIKLVVMIKKLFYMFPNLKCIQHHFYVSGHSYNACDRCFALIERQKKITDSIYIPSHWNNIIRQSKKTEPKFTLTEMQKGNFFSSKQLENLISNRRTSIDGRKINWLKIQSILYSRDEPFILEIKEYSDCEEPTIRISLENGFSEQEFREAKLDILYPEGRAINKSKYEDLQKLLKFIPAQHHDFYKNLNFETIETNDEIDVDD